MFCLFEIIIIVLFTGDYGAAQHEEYWYWENEVGESQGIEVGDTSDVEENPKGGILDIGQLYIHSLKFPCVCGFNTTKDHPVYDNWQWLPAWSDWNGSPSLMAVSQKVSTYTNCYCEVKFLITIMNLNLLKILQLVPWVKSKVNCMHVPTPWVEVKVRCIQVRTQYVRT